MSHDRKPGRVRVVQAGAGPPRRRRGDSAPVIIDAASLARGRTAARRGRAVMVAFFLVAAIGGAVATEMFLPS